MNWMAPTALACLLALAGCAETKDPAVPGDDDGTETDDGNPITGDGDGDGDDSTDGMDGTDGTAGDGDDTTGDGDDTSGDDTTGDGDGDGDTTGDGDGDGDGIEITPTCSQDLRFVGQMFEKPDAPNNGGEETTTPFEATYDSGIAGLLAQAPAEGMAATLDLAITDATVTATNFGEWAGKQFWVQDGKGAVQVYLQAAVMQGTDPVVVKVGSKVSFKVKELKNYFGTLEITQASDFNFTSIGQPVYMDDRTGGSITVADQGRLVRVTGALEGEPTDCNGAKCWTLNYAGQAPVTFRTKSMYVMTGSCVTYVGPVSLFNGAVQLNTLNYDWLWVKSDM
jgi:hypothetical protein